MANYTPVDGLGQAAWQFDPFKVLQVSYTASLPEIKVAYKKRLRAVHPDKNGGDNRAYLMVERAYEWANKYQWGSDLIGGKWIEIFKQASLDTLVLQGEIKNEKIGRNDPCPYCLKEGKKIKWKKCKEHNR